MKRSTVCIFQLLNEHLMTEHAPGVADSKSAQHSLSECQRIFLSATRDFIHVCVCLCRCRFMVLHVCVCVCIGLEYKMQSAAQFQQVEDIFIMTSISFSLFAAADAALPLCAATAAAAVFLFVCVYETVGFAHFRILFCLSQKKTSGRILI